MIAAGDFKSFIYAIIVAVLHITLRTRSLVWLVAFLLADSEGVKTKKEKEDWLSRLHREKR